MNLPNMTSWDDKVLPFQLDLADIRGRIARLDGVLEDILQQHDYPAPVESLVAEAALLTALIGQTIELRWKLSIQIRANGPIRLIATDYFSPASPGAAAMIRAYASFDAEALGQSTGPAFAQIGHGMFALMIDQGEGQKPYQGITPLAGDSLAACAETYFRQSEQLPTRFQLAMGRAQVPGDQPRWRAGGIMLQHMPKASPLLGAGDAAHSPLSKGPEADDDAWRRVNLHLDTVDEIELIGPHLDPRDLLRRLFNEDRPRIFDSQPVKFGCTCSPAKVEQAMSIYSAKDISKMTDAQGMVTADCQFCGAHYEFDPRSLGFEATKKVE